MKEETEKISCHICKKIIPKAAASTQKGRNMSSIFAMLNVWIIGKKIRKVKRKKNK